MKKWLTEFHAIKVSTGELRPFGGDHVKALTAEMAQQWCDEHKPWLKVLGQLIAEIPCKEGTYEPDWSKKIDYEDPELN